MPYRPFREGDLSAQGSLDRRSLRRAFLLGNSFEFLIAFAAILTGAAWLLDPTSIVTSAVADAGGALVVFWALLYVVGGAFIFTGLWFQRAAVELSGLSLFGAATLIDAAALLLERGPAGYRVALTYFAVALATVARARLILLLTRRRR